MTIFVNKIPHHKIIERIKYNADGVSDNKINMGIIITQHKNKL
jgi:hypothetical protein